MGSKGSTYEAILKLHKEASRIKFPMDGALLDQCARLEELEEPYLRWALESSRQVMGSSGAVCGISATVCVQHAQLLRRANVGNSITHLLRPTPSLGILLGCALIPVCDAWFSADTSQFDHAAHVFGWVGGLVISSGIACLTPITSTHA